MNSEHEVLRFEPGEEVIGALTDFVKREGINSAWISALGSAKEVKLGFYDARKKEYQKKSFNEVLEVVDLTGNVGILDGEPSIHIHGSLGAADYKVVGGHVHRLVVNTTVEMHLLKMDAELKRRYDESTGLNLFVS